MAEWLVEEGIGEHRAIRLEAGHIAEARMHWPGRLTVGQVEDARLVSRARGSKRGTIRFASGEEALVDRLDAAASEGADIRCRVTREAFRERDRTKLAQCRPTDDPPRPAPTLAEQLGDEGHAVRVVRRFEQADWEELWLEAWSGHMEFDGGELAFFDTSAMTLIDIDGPDDPRTLALAAAAAVGTALRRFDISGSIGIDFPTLATKSDRKAVDSALDAALAGWPHERTAINGFGFVQLVARSARPSIFQRIHQARVSAATRLLLRRAELLEGAGTLQLTAHPAIVARLRSEWREALARRTGRTVETSADPGLALEAGHVQMVAS